MQRAGIAGPGRGRRAAGDQDEADGEQDEGTDQCGGIVPEAGVLLARLIAERRTLTTLFLFVGEPRLTERAKGLDHRERCLTLGRERVLDTRRNLTERFPGNQTGCLHLT